MHGASGHLAAEAAHHAAQAAHTAALGHGFGHLLQHLKGFQQAVDIHHLQAAAGGNALFAAGVESWTG